MKAKLFESKPEKEIRLANGVQFFSEIGETKESFVARVTEVIERDYVESLELEEVDPTKYKKYSVKQLQASRKNKTGVELRIIQEILVERGALEEHPSEEGAIVNTTLTDDELRIVQETLAEWGALEEHPSEEGAIVNTTLTDDDIPAEGSEEEVAEAQPEAPKANKEKTPKKEKAPKAEAELKPLKKQLTGEEILPKLVGAEKNKGHEITFICTKTKEETKGVIKGVRLDKRNNFIQYRILAEDGNMYGKGIESEDMKIGELAPVPEKEKSPKANKEEAPATESPTEEDSPETQSEE